MHLISSQPDMRLDNPTLVGIRLIPVPDTENVQISGQLAILIFFKIRRILLQIFFLGWQQNDILKIKRSLHLVSLFYNTFKCLVIHPAGYSVSAGRRSSKISIRCIPSKFCR
jgi:hypothetical protein